MTMPSAPLTSFVPQRPFPPSNAGWAVAAVVFFWPLAFAAFNHSLSVYPLWATGDFHGAQYASDRAKWLGKLSLWLCVGITILFIVAYAGLIAAIVSSTPTHSKY